jgi:hypothetical protein
MRRHYWNPAKLFLLAYSLNSHQIPDMENKKKSRGLYWFLFLVSFAAFFGLYLVIGGVCILTLPFVCTYFAKALNIM